MYNYEEAVKYIESIPWTMRKPGLHRMTELMHLLGNPQDRLRFIHIAGTNGKGSTSAMLASVCKEAGYKTGLFTSPHLVKYNERMKFNGEDISDEELAEIIFQVSEKASLMDEEPSEFEVLTAAGFLWFSRKKCDIVVLEVGLGGELDSTNVIKNKELAIITPIGFDHTAILGDSIEEIAKAKAGIITEGCNVVTAFQNTNGVLGEKINEIIRSKCESVHAKLHIPDFESIKPISSTVSGQVFASSYTKEPISLNLIGAYQLQNASTVLEAIKVLNMGLTIRIEEDAVYSGLKNVTWAARFEVLSKDPVFILDGAHNDHGVSAAVRSLKEIFGDKKIIYILGILSDKNIDSMLSELYKNAKCFITLTPSSDRALKSDILADKIKAAGFEAFSFSDTKKAIDHAFGLCEKGHGSAICSLGSLYLAGEVRNILINRETGGF